MTQEVKLRRVQCNFQPENARFLLECDFSKQYSNYYRKRLERTRPFIEFNCRSKWGPSLPIHTLADLAALDCNLDDLEGLLASPSLSPDESANSSFEFAKRMRRHSENSGLSPPVKTSTQKKSSIPQPSTSHEEERLVALSPVDRIATSPGYIIIGTVFKRMRLQPDVVEELSRGDFHVKCDRYLGHYTSQDDTLVLEDSTESISLVGNIDPKKFVTGVTIAILGAPINDGSQFLVRDVCYATPNRLLLCDTPEELESQASSKVDLYLESQLLAGSEPIYLMVVSSLGFHPDMGRRSVLTKSLQNLIDFIWGGEKYSEDDRSSRVARILIAGDSLSDERLFSNEEESRQIDLATRMRQTRQVKPYSGSVQAVKHMDDFFAQLSKTINVDVMPGNSDPSSHLMPQQPFHPCMFPKSCMFSTFNCVTNPFRAIYNENVDIFATSGQNVDIVSKFSKISNPLEIMKSHLIWGNCAPSAPDNLYSAPYEDDDPFIIDFIPEIYIAGCQDSYQADYHYYDLDDNKAEGMTEKAFAPDATDQSPTHRAKDSSRTGASFARKCRSLLLTVPRFCETFSCVLVNLLNLESKLIKFG